MSEGGCSLSPRFHCLHTELQRREMKREMKRERESWEELSQKVT